MIEQNNSNNNQTLYKKMDEMLNIEWLTKKSSRKVMSETTAGLITGGATIASGGITGVAGGLALGAASVAVPVIGGVGIGAVGAIIGCFSTWGICNHIKKKQNIGNTRNIIKENSVFAKSANDTFFISLTDIEQWKIFDTDGNYRAAYGDQDSAYSCIMYNAFDDELSIKIRSSDMEKDNVKKIINIFNLNDKIEKYKKDHNISSNNNKWECTVYLTLEQSIILLKVIRAKMEKIDVNSIGDENLKNQFSLLKTALDEKIKEVTQEQQKELNRKELENNIEKLKKELKYLKKSMPSRKEIKHSKNVCETIVNMYNKYIEDSKKDITKLNNKLNKIKKGSNNINEIKKIEKKIQKEERDLEQNQKEQLPYEQQFTIYNNMVENINKIISINQEIDKAKENGYDESKVVELVQEKIKLEKDNVNNFEAINNLEKKIEKSIKINNKDVKHNKIDVIALNDINIDIDEEDKKDIKNNTLTLKDNKKKNQRKQKSYFNNYISTSKDNIINNASAKPSKLQKISSIYISSDS